VRILLRSRRYEEDTHISVRSCAGPARRASGDTAAGFGGGAQHDETRASLSIHPPDYLGAA
jgi:hypothetical protein